MAAIALRTAKKKEKEILTTRSFFETMAATLVRVSHT
jgi:hypothetical protein